MFSKYSTRTGMAKPILKSLLFKSISDDTHDEEEEEDDDDISETGIFLKSNNSKF